MFLLIPGFIPRSQKVSVESEQSPSLWICECIQLLSPDIFIQFIDFRPLYHTIINQPNRLVRNWECESFWGISFYSASIICTMGGGTPPLLTVTFMITTITPWISPDTTWYDMILSTILLQLHELLLQEPEHLQPGLVLLLLQHRGRRHGHQTVQVTLVTTEAGGCI